MPARLPAEPREPAGALGAAGAGGERGERGGRAAKSMVARTGRAKQRYSEDGNRLVSGCIPVRLREPADRAAGAGAFEVLLVTRMCDPTKWVLPKGGWEVDETLEDAALRETWEEAGVRGDVCGLVGQYDYLGKNAPSQGSSAAGSVNSSPAGRPAGGGGCCGGAAGASCAGGGGGSESGDGGIGAGAPKATRVYMHLMCVSEEAGEWPEKGARSRSWHSLDEALQVCERQWILEALGAAKGLLDSGAMCAHGAQ